MANINYIERHLKTYTVSSHKHNYWEIIYVTEGNGQLEIPSGAIYPYSKGNIICIPPNLTHKNISPSGFKNLHLTIEGLQLHYDQPIVLLSNENTKDFARLLEMCYKYFHLLPIEHEINFALSNAVVCHLTYLISNKKISPVSQTISKIIINNYTNPDFDLDSVYKDLPYCKEHARKVFLMDYKITPTKFLINKRIELAKQLLSERKSSKDSIQEISKSCGFYDQLYFSRIFKKITGIAPKDYKISALDNNKIF